MQKIHSVAVRELAEFAFEKGDLLPAFKTASRMQDGIRGHKALQDLLPVNWRSEVPISRNLAFENNTLRIYGRADAVFLSKEIARIQEFKTTTRDPMNILKYDYPAHWAQGEIYAALFCMAEGIPQAEVRLTSARMNGAQKSFSRNYDIEELTEKLYSYACIYLNWACAVDEAQEKSRNALDSMPFPFDDFREGQRDMAKAVFDAMHDGTNALIEAPTGIGKTAASLYGALLALGRGHVNTIFYLTARTTGRRAAEAALELMRLKGPEIRSVTLSAKEKVCPMEKMDCLGCPLAVGYYDRRRQALREALGRQRIDEACIAELAGSYEVCPFELSLDIAQTADVIICDYNYVFDPKVRLKRFFDKKTQTGLLVDEAHNLADRAREMLSAKLSGQQAGELLDKIRRFEGRDTFLGRAMGELLEVLNGSDAEMEYLSEIPMSILEAVRRFVEIAQDAEITEPDLQQFIFDAQWFLRVSKRFDPEHYRALIQPERAFVSVRLWCFDPSDYLRKALSRVRGTAYFSATLTPVSFYASILGADDPADNALQLASPFPISNLYVASLPVPVTFKDRERSAGTVSQIIHTMVHSKPGNYLACFPSYAYLKAIYGYYRLLWPEDSIICQSESMTEQSRKRFMECFRSGAEHSLLAFVVLGGVFAEGIDLPNELLSGVAIVTVGIPQPTFERQLLQEQLDDADGGGYDAAYVYPGIRRVLQAAGRVIRTETDRGIVLLLDKRFRQEKYRELLPEHWNVREINKMSRLRDEMDRFWKTK